jgi:DNA-binding MarR family transcriptional regulator
MKLDVQEIMGCTCLRMRRATRRLTQIYDKALGPADMTANQFGLLTHLYGVALAGAPGLAIGALAERLGADPTTLNRTLKPLIDRGWVRDAVGAADGRVRLLRLTDKGQRAIDKAAPLWREAQAKVEEALGAKSTRALNELLDLSAAKLA